MSHPLITAGFLAVFDIRQLISSAEVKLTGDFGVDFLFSKDKDIVADRKLLTLYNALQLMYNSSASKVMLYNSEWTETEIARYGDTIEAIKKYAPVIESSGKSYEDFLASISFDGPEAEEVLRKFKISKQNRLRMAKGKTFSRLTLRADEILILRSKGL